MSPTANYWHVFDQDQTEDHIPNLSLNVSRGIAQYRDGAIPFYPYPPIQPASGWFDLTTSFTSEEKHRMEYASHGEYAWYLLPDHKEVLKFTDPFLTSSYPSEYLTAWPYGGW